MFGSSVPRFGGSMRFNAQNVSRKPPSRGVSQKKKREVIKRADSANRLMREDRNTHSRGTGAASLARTTGKRASRIIFTTKQEAAPEPKISNRAPFPSTDLPAGNYRNEYKAISTYKPGISSYLDSQISKPSITSTLGMNNLIGSTASSSNFPKKIVIKRDSIDESTRDDTKITKSSTYSRSDQTSKC